VIRHDAAMCWPNRAIAVARHPGHIGPVIENGFYYDFFRNQPFTPEDFAAIEKRMREIIAGDKPFTKEVWPREQAKRVFRDKASCSRWSWSTRFDDQEIKIYKQGDGSISAAART